MKSVSQLRSVSDIKGIHYGGVRSIPKVQRSSYLELYVIDREMYRLGNEKFALDKRRKTTQGRLDCLMARKAKLQEEIAEDKGTKNHSGASKGKVFRAMPLKY